MSTMRHSARIALVLSGCLVLTAAQAGQVWLPGVGIGGVEVSSVQSFRERQFSRTVHQQYDFSCGSAALATLLTYQFHDPVGERSVFQIMWDQGNQAKIRREGFSLLDIKHYLDARGYVSNGYIAPLNKLAQVGIPAIALISDHGYNHFVVVKGLRAGRVLVGDPSRGARSIPLERFKRMQINPILFVITNYRDRAVFNGRADWATRPMAPLGMAITVTDLATATVLRPGAGDF